MGKRSDYIRKEKDFYETPLKAVQPLIPHLPRDGFLLIDPCAGEGKIGDHVRDLMPDAQIPYLPFEMYDDEYEMDVMQADATTCQYGTSNELTLFITNPPWSREILHPIIDNLSWQEPTWLLFDADWMHTNQASEYLRYCKKIVSVGRVKWIEGSKGVGKDNCAWYLFDRTDSSPIQEITKTIFVGK